MKKNIYLCEIKILMPLKKGICLSLFLFLSYLMVIIIHELFFWHINNTLEDIVFDFVCLIAWFFWGKYCLKIFKEKFKCVPIISKYISRRKLKELILADSFEPVEEFKECSFYNKFLIGQNWLYINGYFISKNAVVSVALLEKRSGSGSYGGGTPYIDYYISFTCINGETEKVFIRSKNWQVKSYKIECELNENFKKILVNTLYKFFDINGICIQEYAFKEYDKKIDVAKTLAKKENIKCIKIEDILFSGKNKQFLISELENIKIEGEDWLSIVERKNSNERKR